MEIDLEKVKNELLAIKAMNEKWEKRKTSLQSIHKKKNTEQKQGGNSKNENL